MSARLTFELFEYAKEFRRCLWLRGVVTVDRGVGTPVGMPVGTLVGVRGRLVPRLAAAREIKKEEPSGCRRLLSLPSR